LETAPGVAIDPDQILTRDVYDLEGKAEEVRSWLAIEGGGTTKTHNRQLDANRHGAGIHAFCLRFQRPLEWSAFGIWLAMLLHCHGSDILRVKGLLNIGANSGPVVINGVQHLVHPPDHLPAWPDDDHSSRVIFIVRGLSRDILERSLAAFASEAAEEKVV
jgi:G3E family GTPase